ncbi:MAG: flippase [Oscillochloridaceae bacterium umkhey_bin13]
MFHLVAQRLQQRLRSQSEFGKIARNSFWLVIEKALRMALAVTVSLLVARYLGPDRFGLLSYALSFVMIIAVLARLGLDAILVRDLVKQTDATPSILGTGFGLKLSAGMLAALLTIGLALYVFDDQLGLSLVFIIALGTILSAFDVATFWFQAEQRSQTMALLRMGVMIVVTALKLVCVLIEAPLIAFAWLLMADLALPPIVLTVALLFMRPELRRWSWQPERAWAYLREGWPLLLSNAMVLIYLRIDQVMLGLLATTRDVGYYAAAVRFSEIWGLLPVAIAWAAFPALVRAREQSDALLFQRTQQLYDFMVLSAFAVIGLMGVLGGPIIEVLLGSEFAPAAPILMVHIWSSIFVFVELVRAKVLITQHLARAYSLSTIIGVLTNVLLNLWLIPLYAGLGAAIATLVSYAMVTLGASLIIPALRPEGWRILLALFAPVRWIGRKLGKITKEV